MFTLNCDIKIGKLRISQVNDVKIEKSWLKLADKAVVKLPRAYEVMHSKVKVGEAVNIKLGYEGVKLYQEFEGYVRRITPGTPVQIECEDATWLMRRVQVEKTWSETVTLKEMVNYIIDKVNEKMPEQAQKITPVMTLPSVSFDEYTIHPNNAAEAMEKLKKKFGLAAYFRGHQLYVGIAYVPAKQEVEYEIGRNVITDQLTYRHEDDVKYKVKITSVLKNNDRIEFEIGDTDAEVRSLFYYNITDRTILKQKAETEIKKYKYTGFDGNLTSFLIPFAEPNMTAVLTDNDYPDLRNGKYVIDSVVTTYGIKGGRRVVSLGIQVGDSKEEPISNEN